jgi:pyridinium-3,5-biscarboxylic acid mononucleotide sulfurtransferase
MTEANKSTLGDRLDALLDAMAPVAVAVSGGVDSMTLATAAHRRLGSRATMLHAVSPAVPAEATRRVKELAAQECWQLTIIDAREFDDPNYLANPVDRCFYCKTNLYDRVAEYCTVHTSAATIVSGTNTDDLSDYRPGLRAASEHDVRHPFVEVGADKPAIRTLARELGLGTVAELPASPCLSSRVETGISIEPRTLGFIEAVEARLTSRLGFNTVRCRVRHDGVVIELDASDLATLDAAGRNSLLDAVRDIAAQRRIDRPVSLAEYRRGSAFLHVEATS